MHRIRAHIMDCHTIKQEPMQAATPGSTDVDQGNNSNFWSGDENLSSIQRKMWKNELQRHLQITSEELHPISGESASKQRDENIHNLLSQSQVGYRCAHTTTQNVESPTSTLNASSLLTSTCDILPKPEHGDFHLPCDDDSPSSPQIGQPLASSPCIPANGDTQSIPQLQGLPCLENGDTQSPPLPADQIMSTLWEIKHDLQQLIAGQRALRESVEYLHSVLKPQMTCISSSSSKTQRELTPQITSGKSINTGTKTLYQAPSKDFRSATRRPAPTVTPVYIASNETGKFLLGGSEGLVRDIFEYHGDVRRASTRAASKPEATGRMLCSILMRKEFSKEDLASKNVTGKSRDPKTKKCVPVPKLDSNILQAIFRQARLQFPDFHDTYTDTKCPTVQLLNDTCKHIRQKMLLAPTD
ncbi:uncharacterized protein LOC110986780 [Acanthaster planci]|uniref:Uncharacterized protein LOC110986780 n=1 Tax=Acanthaster planci TaxID=133434 RepID=A0A8B7ZI29_ACAPL|nr:uncharacterized protein LOC110986780 [Acanthaster planci]